MTKCASLTLCLHLFSELWLLQLGVVLISRRLTVGFSTFVPTTSWLGARQAEHPPTRVWREQRRVLQACEHGGQVLQGQVAGFTSQYPRQQAAVAARLAKEDAARPGLSAVRRTSAASEGRVWSQSNRPTARCTSAVPLWQTPASLTGNEPGKT